jgi:hypothetical protein
MRITKHLRLFWAVCLFFTTPYIYAQTDTLLNPLKEGGFELGNGSFAANGWSVSTNNTTAINQWTANRGASRGFSGSYCAYVTNNPTGNPPVHNYSVQGSERIYFYREVTFPKGKTALNLSFNYYNAARETSFDIWLLPRQATSLVDGRLLRTINFVGSYSLVNLPLDYTIIGNCTRDTTWQLAFAWRNSPSTIYGIPPALDNIGIFSDGISSLLTGIDTVFTIDKTRPTEGTNFNNFKDAITAVNNFPNLCVSPKTLIFNVSSGQTFDEAPISISRSGTVNMPIIFQKKGNGANPVIRSKTSPSGFQQAALTLAGCDYLTFDGIDIIENTNNTPNLYLLYGIVVQDGAQNNTLKNCMIVLDSRSMTYYYSPTTAGIIQRQTTASTIQNSNNRYLNLTIKNCRNGISVGGDNIEIGSTDPTQFTRIEVPEMANVESYAVIASGLNLKVHHIKSNVPLVIGAKGQTDIYNNIITSLTASNALHVGVYENTTINIFNNFLSLPRSSLRPYQSCAAISLAPSNHTPTSSTILFNVYNNSTFVDATWARTLTGSSNCLNLNGACRFNAKNNIFFNATQESNRTNPHYCISYLGNGNPDSSSALSINYNAFWRKSPQTKIAYYHDSRAFTILSANTLAEWQNAYAGVRPDLNSVEADPQYVSETDLHAYSLGIDGRGTTPLNNLTVDIDNEPRTAPFDIGADQFTRLATDLQSLTLSSQMTRWVFYVQISRAASKWSLKMSGRSL